MNLSRFPYQSGENLTKFYVLITETEKREVSWLMTWQSWQLTLRALQVVWVDTRHSSGTEWSLTDLNCTLTAIQEGVVAFQNCCNRPSGWLRIFVVLANASFYLFNHVNPAELLLSRLEAQPGCGRKTLASTCQLLQPQSWSQFPLKLLVTCHGNSCYTLTPDIESALKHFKTTYHCHSH